MQLMKSQVTGLASKLVSGAEEEYRRLKCLKVAAIREVDPEFQDGDLARDLASSKNDHNNYIEFLCGRSDDQTVGQFWILWARWAPTRPGPSVAIWSGSSSGTRPGIAQWSHGRQKKKKSQKAEPSKPTQGGHGRPVLR